MKHAQLAVSEPPGHHAQGNAWKYLPFAVVGTVLLGAYEYSPGLFAVLAIFGGLVLALRQRIERLRGDTIQVARSPHEFVRGDGGSFPGAEPSAKRAPVAHVVVVDGGTLEHHHS